MHLRDKILSEHSKSVCAEIVSWVGTSQKRFDELFQLFISDEYRVMQRAGWPLSYCVENHPRFITSHFEKIIQQLKNQKAHPAVKRNCMRLLQHVSIPEINQGELMDICFACIADPKEKAAVKAFALTVLQNLSNDYPEIKQEIRTIVQDRWDSETAAFRSRAKKFYDSRLIQ